MRTSPTPKKEPSKTEESQESQEYQVSRDYGSKMPETLETLRLLQE
jgi:hypothetical protein